MATDNFKVKNGLSIQGSDVTEDGDIGYDSVASAFLVQSAGVVDSIATVAGTQILTNKTIDYNNNTITNLPITPLPPDVVTESANQILTNKVISGTNNSIDSIASASLLLDTPLVLDEQGSSPATPAAGKVKLYAKADGKLYKKADDGNEELVGASGNFIGFSATTNTAGPRGAGTLDYDIVEWDYGSGYNNTTYEYTIPVGADGLWQFWFDSYAPPSTPGYVDLMHNGVTVQRVHISSEAQYTNVDGDLQIDVVAGDVLRVDAGAGMYIGPWTKFSGYLVSAPAYINGEINDLTLIEGPTPSTPATGLVKLYSKTDGHVYKKADDGSETAISTPNISFRATNTGAIFVNTPGTLPFNVEIYDNGSWFDHTTYTATAPYTGLYMFTGSTYASAGDAMVVDLLRNGTSILDRSERSASEPNYDKMPLVTTCELTAGDTVRVDLISGTTHLNSIWANFTGVMLRKY